MKLIVLCFLVNGEYSLCTILEGSIKFNDGFGEDIFIQKATGILRHIITNMHTVNPELQVVVRNILPEDVALLAQYGKGDKKTVSNFKAMDQSIVEILSSRVGGICQDLAK
ncbi:MAG: hypothetical protein RLY57_504 [Candidatus Parcubacteria bacterium]|jgi:hypothetical protein